MLMVIGLFLCNKGISLYIAIIMFAPRKLVKLTPAFFTRLCYHIQPEMAVEE